MFFYDDYILTPLDDVEKFIRTHKHLPGIKSESEILQHGLNVGENQADMLLKIEELTLYIIELNKKINSLQQQINILKN